ncbi:MAG: endolytic transglycosylase MltG, partial [Oscillospiraceae bacterium]
MGKLYDYEDQEKKDFVLKMNTDEIPDYNAKKARKNKRRSKVSALTTSIFAIAIVGVSIVLSIIIINSGIEVLAIKKENRSIVVDIPENSDVPKISKILEERGVISSANLFNFYYKLVGNNIGLNFGSYELNRNMSYDTIIDNLARYSAAKDEITVTFPEGFTIYEIALRLEENNVCSADEFIKVVNEKDFGYDFEKSISNNSLKFHKTEGFLFPDTYNFYEKDNAYNVAKKLFKNFNNKITDELKQQMKDMNYTLEQTIIIASIIEKEAP